MKKIIYLFVIGILSASLSAACNDETIKGNGKEKKETRTLGSFDKISAAGSVDIRIEQGGTELVTVETDENLMEYIITVVENGSLKIHTKDNVYLKPTKDIVVHVSCKMLIAISSGGSGDIKTSTKLTGDVLSISQGGSGDYKLDLAVDKLKISKAGSGDFTITGSVGEMKISSAGSGDVKAKDLNCLNAEISSAGSGDFILRKGTPAKISNVGSGEVSYE